MDGLGRARATQAPLPGAGNFSLELVPFRQVAVTRYDSAGQVTGTSAVFRNQGTAGSGGPSSPDVADLPSYNDLVLDWAGRTVISRLQADGITQNEGKVTTTYNGDHTVVQPAAGCGHADRHVHRYLRSGLQGRRAQRQRHLHPCMGARFRRSIHGSASRMCWRFISSPAWIGAAFPWARRSAGVGRRHLPTSIAPNCSSTNH